MSGFLWKGKRPEELSEAELREALTYTVAELERLHGTPPEILTARASLDEFRRSVRENAPTARDLADAFHRVARRLVGR